MRWGIWESAPERWRPWFAWRPVKAERPDGSTVWVWLEWIDRLKIQTIHGSSTFYAVDNK